MQSLYDAAVILQLVRHVLVLGQQRVNTGLVASHVFTGHQAQRVQHPRVHVIRVGEELVEVDGLEQPLPAVSCQVHEVVPGQVDFVDALLDFV